MDKKYMNWVGGIIQEAEEKVCQINKAAEIDLKFRKEFKSSLLDYIISNSDKKELCFEKTEVLQKGDNYNIHRGMDDDLINEVARKGYIYRGDLSSSDCLIFQQGDILKTKK